MAKLVVRPTAELSIQSYLPEIWHEPLPVVINILTEHPTVEAVHDNLPDVALFRPATD